MVTKSELIDALSEQSDKISEKLNEQYKTINEKIDSMKTDIISSFNTKNDILKKRVDTVESKIIELEKSLQLNLQYQRKSNVIIDGIPSEVQQNDLEGLIIRIFNSVCFHHISSREIVNSHRVSAKSDKVLVKFVNPKDAKALIDSQVSLSRVNNESIGLDNSIKLHVSDHLTPYNSNLAFKCRNLKRSGKIVKIKTQNCVVKILTFIDGVYTWHDIQHVHDLENIFPEIVIND